MGAGGELDQLQLVAIGILHEGDHRAPLAHRPRFAHHLAPLAADRLAGADDVVNPNGDMAVGRAQLVAAGIPVVGEFNHGRVGLLAIAHKGQGETAAGVIAATQQLHAHHFGVEAEGSLQIRNPQHRVEQTHGAGQVRSPHSLQPAAWGQPPFSANQHK